MSAASSPAVNKKLLVALGAIVVLAALFLLVIQPLLLGDDEQVAAPPSADADLGLDNDLDAGGDRTVDSDSGLGSGLESGLGSVELDGDAAPATSDFDVFAARDPFEQLVKVEAAGTAPATPTGTPTPGSPTPAPTTTPAPTPTATPTPASDTTIEGTTIEMVDTFTTAGGVDGATVTVNGTGYNVEEGDAFGDGIELHEVSDGCGTFSHDGSRFVLCMGDTIRK